MACKLIAFIIVLSLLQYQALSDLAAGGGYLQVVELRNQVKVAQQQISASIKTAKSTIQDGITTAQDALDKQIADLEAKAKESTCVLQLPQITSDSITACDQADQLKAAQVKSITVYRLYPQINFIYFRCPSWSSDQAQCMQDFSDNINKQINSIVGVVNGDLGKALEDTNKCVENKQSEISKQIDEATAALDNC